MKKKIKNNKINELLISKKGFALIATLIFVFILSTLGIALLTMTRNDIKLSTLQRDSTDSFYLADSGIERAISWLEKQSIPPTSVPPPFDGTVTIEGLGGGTYTVEIVPDASSGIGNKRYTITSIARAGYSNSTRKVISVVQARNFAGYAYFTDLELMSSGTKIWFITGDIIGGKMHSNDQIHIYGDPIFKDKVTSHATTIDFMYDTYDDYGYDDGQLFPGFEKGLELEKNGENKFYIELPQYREISSYSDAQSLARIAAGTLSIDPNTSAGIYVPHIGNTITGGIYVKGTIEDLSLGVDINSNSVTTIKLGGKTTTITLDTVLNQTIVYEEESDTTLSYNGFTNGLLYVDGKIESLHANNTDGGLKGKVTIAASKKITITDDILYNSRIEQDVDFSNPDVDLSLITDSLGLISELDITIAKEIDTYDLEINAIMMALGESFEYEGYKSRLRGMLNVFGAFIQKRRGPVGMFSSYTGERIYGYSKNYIYDTRMASTDPDVPSSIPPYFPTTGNYDKLSWREIQ